MNDTITSAWLMMAMLKRKEKNRNRLEQSSNYGMLSNCISHLSLLKNRISFVKNQ